MAVYAVYTFDSSPGLDNSGTVRYYDDPGHTNEIFSSGFPNLYDTLNISVYYYTFFPGVMHPLLAQYLTDSFAGIPAQSGNTGKYLTTDGSAVSWGAIAALGASRFSAYSAGTAYTLTTSSAKIDFGTTDPVITLTTPGTYLILSNLKIEYSGLTTALNALSFKLRRTNNTAADLTNATTTFNVPAVTLLTGTGGDCDLPPVFYTTSNSNDVIEMWGNRSGGITLGSIQVGEASLVAIRIA